MIPEPLHVIGAAADAIRHAVVEEFVLKGDEKFGRAFVLAQSGDREIYEGYLSDFLGTVRVVNEATIGQLLNGQHGHVLADPHDVPAIAKGGRLWLGPHDALAGPLLGLFDQRDHLPEDCYFIPAEREFLIAITHTYYEDGRRFCLQAFTLIQGQGARIILNDDGGEL